jgi:protein gp37
MTRTTAIEWTEHTWNPFVGCSIKSAGCKNCYAMKTAHRMSLFPNPNYAGTTEMSKSGPVWTGRVNRNSDAAMRKPLKISGRALIFVNSMADFFADEAADAWRTEAIQVMADAPQHVYQILTKRPENILATYARLGMDRLPPHVWIGTTVEDHRVIDRIDYLRAVPAGVRFISAEPLIGALDGADLTGISWVITGGESGPRARLCKPAWVREIRELCEYAKIPLFHKQWGSYQSNPLVYEEELGEAEARRRDPHGKGGKLLDGKIIHQFPRQVRELRRR